MIVHKAYKFRLYPNHQQQELINQTFGCNRFIYNYYLYDKQTEYENKKNNDYAIKD